VANTIAGWYDKYGHMVFVRCHKILGNEEEARDATQNVFLNLLKIDEARLNDSYPTSMLWKMATNECFNRLKVRNREKRQPWIPGESDVSEVPAKEGEPDYSIENRSFEKLDAKLRVEMILEEESQDTRMILYYYFWDNMTLKEIAEEAGITIQAVSKRIKTFKKRARLKWGVFGD
jgi:RNA polymerase sigma-70 factor (ECF subfamily)